MENERTITGGRERLGWVDLLRVAACMAVVFSHSCDAFTGQFDMDKDAFLTGVWSGSLVRPSVPLFVMMTAVLLLPLKPGTTVNTFYKRRIGRILPPLIFWSLALPILMHLYFVYVSPGSGNPLLDTSAYTSGGLVQKLSTFVFNFNFDTVPLWYLYMLVGIYLVMPIIGAWLERASRKEIRTVLKVWVVTLFLPYVQLLAPYAGYAGNYGNMGILGVCDWNPFGTFYYMSGFTGYVLLAYYLVKYPLTWSSGKMAAIFIPMFAAGYLITAGGYIWLNNYYPGNYAYLEIIWYFCSINVLMMTLPVFAACSRLKLGSGGWLGRLAGLTFGIYLCHYIFVFVAYDLLDATGWPIIARLVSAFAVAFAGGAVLTRLFNLTRLTSRLVD